MSERDAFLDYLAENEDDTTARLVYADWLDERGEHEEADRQRKWPAAKEWLVRFFEENDGGDYIGNLNSYEELIERGRTAMKEASEHGIVFECDSNESLCDALRANAQEFWTNWSVVTGVPLPAGFEHKSYFGCSC